MLEHPQTQTSRLVTERRLAYQPPPPEEPAARRFPYAIVIAAGTALGYLAGG